VELLKATDAVGVATRRFPYLLSWIVVFARETLDSRGCGRADLS
jgi:hypothetical protein